MGTSMSTNPLASGSKVGKASGDKVRALVVYVENVHHSFLPRDVYHLKSTPL